MAWVKHTYLRNGIHAHDRLGFGDVFEGWVACFWPSSSFFLLSSSFLLVFSLLFFLFRGVLAFGWVRRGVWPRALERKERIRLSLFLVFPRLLSLFLALFWPRDRLVWGSEMVYFSFLLVVLLLNSTLH